MNSKKPQIIVEQYETIRSQHDNSNALYLSDVILDIQTSPELEEIVNSIRNANSPDKKNEIKTERLPAFRPCVTVPCIKPYETNGIVQLDVDKITIEQSVKYKQLLIDKIPSLLYVFISPKGGLKLGVMTDLIGDNSDTYREAYFIVVEHIENLLGTENCPAFDDNCKSLALNCFLSSDIDAYYCDEPEILKISAKAKEVLAQKTLDEAKKHEEYLKSLPEKSTYDKTEDQDVIDALAVIPRDYGYADRLPINFAVLSHFGYEGINLLFNHWITPDRKKLQNDLNAQLKSHNAKGGRKYTVATLFDEAQKHGYRTDPPRNTEKAEAKGKEPTYAVPKLFTLSEANNELDRIIEEFIEKREDTAVLIEAGVGKTWGSLKKLNDQHLKQKRQFKVAYFVNTKSIAQERRKEMVIGDDEHERLINVLKIIEKAGGGVSVMKGYGEDTCPLWKEGDVYNRNRCADCNYWAGYERLCPYEHQYLGEHKSRIDAFRLYQHAHLFQPSRLDKIEPEWKPDVIVVDEDVVSNMIEMEYVKKGSSFKILDWIIDEIVEEDGKGLSQTARAYEDQLKTDRQKLLRNKTIEELDDREKATYEVISVLLEYAKPISCTQASVWVEDGSYLYVGWVKRIDPKWQGIPMLYLDASGNQKIISRVLKRKFKFHKIRCHYQPNVEVVQVQNNTVSKGWCHQNRDKLKSFIELMEQKPISGKTGYISYKNVKSEPFITKLVADENTCGWYGKLRGSNHFKEFSQLIVFGRHFIPTEEMVRIAKIVYRDWDPNWLPFTSNEDDFEPRPFNDAMRSVEKTIRMKDGEHKTLKTSQYIDWRLHELSEHLNQSETYQALHRLRLVHGTEMKQLVYVQQFPDRA